MPDPVPDLQPDEPTTRAAEARAGELQLVPGWVGILVLVALLLLAGLGGYALRGVVNKPAETRLTELDEIESMQERVAGNPFDTQARLGLADSLKESGRLKLALDEYEALLELDPRDIAALYARATILLELDRPDEAETSLWKVLALDEGHVGAAETLGDYYASKKQFRSLIEAVRPAATAHPTEARLQYLMGLAYENLGQREWAAARYRLALDASPDLPEAVAGLERLEGSQ